MVDLVPSTSGFSAGLSNFVANAINQRLQKRALGGDQAALTRLSSRDPRAAGQIGDIFNQQREDEQLELQRQQELQSQSDDFKRRIAQSFVSASGPEAQKQVLESVIPTLQNRPGFESLVADIQDDIARFDADPQSVANEYFGASVVFDTQDQLKIGARKIFSNGTILQSTPQGPRVFAADGTQLQGQDAQSAVKQAFQDEVTLAGSKARAGAQARADVQLGTGQEIKAREQRGKSKEQREQGFIDAGVDAADSLATINRAIQLLDTVETGGFSAAQLRAKQLFGIESADEGELANQLGTSVLQQLRPIFGAAFTAAEGERLERLSAGFGRSPAANKRILQQQLKITERASRRAIRAAESRGDDFAAEEIRNAMEQAKNLLDLDSQTQAPESETPQSPSQGIQFLGFE